jgi:hypothetical protein
MEQMQVEGVAVSRGGGMPIPAYGRDDLVY